MSTQRRAKLEHKGYGPNGFNLCFCGCGQECKPPKQNWASKACVIRHFERNDPSYQRRLVGERDKGICQKCGLDTEKLEARLRDLNQRMSKQPREIKVKMLTRLLASLPKGWDRVIGLYVYGGLKFFHLWEMDHIIPVVEGGGGCDLTNLRTLCIPCHKAATAALARRRAERRNGTPQFSFGLPKAP